MSYLFLNDNLFRKDILDYLDSLGSDEIWISLELLTINLSGQQAKVLQGLIAQNKEYANDPLGIPLDLIPLDGLSNNENFKGGLLTELNEIRNEGYNPFISVFQHRPYVYLDGEIQGDLFGATTHILRVGDSLVAGDSNNGNGLALHLEMLWTLLCGMQDLTTQKSGSRGFFYSCNGRLK